VQFRAGQTLEFRTDAALTGTDVTELVGQLAKLGLRPTFSHIGADGALDLQGKAISGERIKPVEQVATRSWPTSGASYIGKEHIWHALNVAGLKTTGKDTQRNRRNLASRVMNFTTTIQPWYNWSIKTPSDFFRAVYCPPSSVGLVVKDRDDVGLTLHNSAERRLIGDNGGFMVVQLAGLVAFSNLVNSFETELPFHGFNIHSVEALRVATDTLRPYAVCEGLDPVLTVPLQ